MRRLCSILILGSLLGSAAAEEPTDLPPASLVARVLMSAPTVRAADSVVDAEEAHRSRLEAGPHEWSLRLATQRRRVTPSLGPDERFQENAASLERAFRIPGKASVDAELGAQGVAIAETARGDALHEAGRTLLKTWFAWLREGEAVRQWSEQHSILEQQAAATSRRQQLGDAARLDTVLADAALAQAQAQLAQARMRERTAAEELRRRHPGLPLPAQVPLSQPVPVDGDEESWINAILEHSHELGIARAEARRALTAARRGQQERVPDPILGLHAARERGGEEQLLGISITIPLPSGARLAAAEAGQAQAAAASHRETAALQKITAEAASLYHAAIGAVASWESSRQAASRLAGAAEMTSRAYRLGEGTLAEVLTTRRLANEAQLAARLAQIEALELRYRLLLDAHRLWPLDDHDGH